MNLTDAIALAKAAHEGQTDKGGAPYFEHVARVAEAVKPYGKAYRVVAYLHDVMESDTARPLTFHGLMHLAYGLSVEQIDAIDCLTRQDGESYTAYIKRCGRNRLACAVKIADLNDNMDLSRIPEPTDEDRARVRKYAKALKILEAVHE